MIIAEEKIDELSAILKTFNMAEISKDCLQIAQGRKTHINSIKVMRILRELKDLSLNDRLSFPSALFKAIDITQRSTI